MTEIERIIDEVCKRIDPNYNGEIYIRDRNHTPPNNWTRLSKETIAKAIEQYVIKAREEALIGLVPNHLIIQKCLWFGYDNDAHRPMRIDINHIDNDLNKPLNYEEAFKKAIAELKKGLK